jgi:hypothetical protein
VSRIQSILFLLLVFLLVSSGPPSLAAPSGQEAMPETYGPDTQFWRTGVTIQHTPSYANLSLRDLSPVATFKSNDGDADIFFVLGAAARLLRVAELKIYLLSRSGSYTGAAAIGVEARSLAGIYNHAISAATLNAQTISTAAWHTIALSANRSAQRLSPGQALVIHFHLAGAPAGNLQVNAIFQAAVTHYAFELYLPLVRK